MSKVKNRFFLLILLLFLTVPVFSQTMINFNIGDVGLAANLPLNDIHNFEMNLSFLHIGAEDKQTGIGADFSPIYGYLWQGRDKSNSGSYEEDNFIDENNKPVTFAMSLLNIKFYWNILKLSYLNFGPFASASYMFFDKDFYWEKFVLTCGLQIGLRLPLGRSNYNILNAEFGYRNIDGKHKYYIGGKIDYFTLLILKR